MFNARSPQPKCIFMSRPKQFLTLSSKPGEITGKEFSLKLAMLLPLTTASRVIEVHHLNIENMAQLKKQ